MADIFSGLEGLGLGDINETDIFAEKKEAVKEVVKEEKKPVSEKEFLFDSTVTCPVCEREFKTRTVRTTRLRLDRTDTDLRPVYKYVDPAKYDVVLCQQCGYASMRKTFGQVTQKQMQKLIEKVSTKYVGKTYPEIYDYDVAIERHKLALYDAIVMEVKDSERAYLCLKIAWLYRAKWETGEGMTQEEIGKCKEFDKEFCKNAVEGFKRAYSAEKFPVLGLEEEVVQYLIGELSRRVGNTEEALKWLSEVIVSNKANARLKDRARDSKELIKEAKSAN